MRVLLTGSTGQLGTALRQAEAPGLALLAHDRRALDLAGDPAAIEAAVAAAAPDVVLNAGAYTAVDRAEEEPELAARVNGAAVAALARAASAAGALLVQVSTDYVFDGRLGRPYREGDPTSPLGVYGRTKQLGEVAAEGATRHLIVRTSWVYSATGKNFLKTMWRLAAAHPRLRVVDDQRARPTSADQLAAALLALLQRARDGGALPPRLHVTGGGDEASWRDFAAEITAARAAHHGGEATPVDAISTEDFGAPAPRPARSTLDTSRAAELGIAPGDWRAEVRRTCAVIAAAEERDA